MCIHEDHLEISAATAFALAAQHRVETVSFTLLGELLPQFHFERVVFPLWTALKDCGFVQSNHASLPKSVHNPELRTILQHGLEIVPPVEIERIAKTMEECGVFHWTMGHFISPALPEHILANIYRVGLSPQANKLLCANSLPINPT